VTSCIHYVLTDFTIMTKWKVLSVNGCECNSTICHLVSRLGKWIEIFGDVLKNNDSSAGMTELHSTFHSLLTQLAWPVEPSLHDILRHNLAFG